MLTIIQALTKSVRRLMEQKISKMTNFSMNSDTTRPWMCQNQSFRRKIKDLRKVL